jgi:glucuronokinase
MRITRHRAHARAGLIGNPSDGYGGKTIAFAIRQFSAEVVMYPWDQLEIIWSDQDKNRFDSVDDLVTDVNLNGYYGGVRLVKATVKRFVEFCRQEDLELHDQPFSVRYHTNIPRGVGLAGSSAIVVATLRCLLDFYAIPISLPLQASLARSVENDELNIACGYQDRVAQVYEGLVCMDFSLMHPQAGLAFGRYEALDSSRLAQVYIAYDLAASKSSGSVHGPLRTRLRNNSELTDTMAEIADLTPQARLAIEQGCTNSLHMLIDQNFDLRCQLYDIQPELRAIVNAARAIGASAKFAGSGGAIVGTYENDTMYEKLARSLHAASPNWRVLRPHLVPSAELLVSKRTAPTETTQRS